jgi:hypothetical protein
LRRTVNSQTKKCQVDQLIDEIVSENWRQIFLDLPYDAKISSLKKLTENHPDKDSIHRRYKSIFS